AGLADKRAAKGKPNVIGVLPLPLGTSDLVTLIDGLDPFAILPNLNSVIAVLNLPLADNSRIAAGRARGGKREHQSAGAREPKRTENRSRFHLERQVSLLMLSKPV